ncbi:integrase core domain-containing protein [Spiribacter sp. 221]|uniref:integrase core domain-containing protein n=1 Tax=Spiribacter onubensis TaxID=3122420 RepID=UPI00349FA74A
MNHIWSFDFMSDALYSGRRFRCLNIIDEGTREALAVIPDTSLPAARVVRELKQIGSVRGLSQRIRIDNGPEMLAQVFTDWRKDKGIELAYFEPGKPYQNAYIERFNRSSRDELLDRYLFTSLSQVREMSAAWMISYNEERPHDSLGRIPPAEFRRQITGEVSTFNLSA